MKFLFFGQNKEQIPNMFSIAKELEKLGHKCFFYNTYDIYKQELNLSEFEIVRNKKFHNYKCSFYELNSFNRIIYLLKVRYLLKTIAQQYDFFVFGNDGAIQRMLNYEGRKLNKKTVILLDALISDYSFSLWDSLKYSKQKLKDINQYFKYWFSKKISVLFSNSKFSPYLPSLIGAANVDEIYTIGPHSKKVLEKYKNKGTKIFAYGLPRMIKEKPDILNTNAISKSLCYVTGAYKWHGLNSYNKYQHEDINLIISLLNEEKYNEIKLFIRIHPRENREDYLKYLNKNVFLDETSTIEQSFEKYTLFISQISTVIVQGINLNKIVYSMLIYFPFWKVKNSFVANENVNKIHKEQDLTKLLDNVKDEKPFKLAFSAEDFISRSSKSCVGLITNSIVNLKNEV